MKKIKLYSVSVLFIVFNLLISNVFAQVKIENLQVVKLNHRIGSTVVVTGKLQNETNHPVKCHLTVEDIGDVSLTKTVYNSDIVLAKNEGKTVEIKFTAALPMFGHAVKWTLSDPQGKLLDKELALYTVTDNPYRTTVWCPSTFGNASPRDGTRPEFAKRLHDYCMSSVELFSPWPSLWIDMDPVTETWRSGQGFYPESVSSIKSLVTECHKRGIAVFAYQQSTVCGSVGADWAREHPEWLAYNKKGRPIAHFNLPGLKKYRHPEGIAPWGRTADINHAFGAGIDLGSQGCLQYGIDQMKRGTKRFEFDGVRWDGNPDVADKVAPFNWLGIGTITYNWKGEIFKGDTDQYNSNILRQFKDAMSQINPHFVWGYNWSPDSQGHLGETTKKTWAVESRDSMLLDEVLVLTSEWRSGKKSDPTWLWLPYIDRVKRSVKMLDGTSGIHMVVINMVPNAIYNRHMATLLFASRTRLLGGWHAFPFPKKAIRFAFRNSALLYDASLREVSAKNSNIIVNSPKELWWKKFCYQRNLKNGTSQDIVHLLNPPVKPFRDMAEKKAPLPIDGIAISLKKRPGYAFDSLVVLDDEDPEHRAKEIRSEDGVFKLPTLKWWNIVVVTWSKKE